MHISLHPSWPEAGRLFWLCNTIRTHLELIQWCWITIWLHPGYFHWVSESIFPEKGKWTCALIYNCIIKYMSFSCVKSDNTRLCRISPTKIWVTFLGGAVNMYMYMKNVNRARCFKSILFLSHLLSLYFLCNLFYSSCFDLTYIFLVVVQPFMKCSNQWKLWIHCIPQQQWLLRNDQTGSDEAIVRLTITSLPTHMSVKLRQWVQ